MRSLGAAVCLLAMAGVVNAAGPAEKTVGRYGDPLRLVVRGTEHFTPEEVGGALSTDLDVLLAAHPAAPLRAYLSLLRDKVTEGYRYAGFRDVKVAATADEETGGTVVAVEEGPQFVAGEVRIVGTRHVAAKFLVERLTQPYLPPQAMASSGGDPDAAGNLLSGLEGNKIEREDALWLPGKPAKLDTKQNEKIIKRVRDTLDDSGCFSADFAIEFPQSGPTTVDLLVSIADEGPQAKADAIEVTGNHRHTSQEILDYLGITPGMPLTEQACVDMERHLWQSGRFRWQKVTPVAPDAPGGPFRLRIEVEEYDKVPRLSEKLSEVDETLLRYQRWLSDTAAMDDIVFECEIEAGPVVAVLSPTKGLMVQWSDHVAVVTDDQIRLYSMGQQRKLVAPALKHAFDISYRLHLDREGDDTPDLPFHFAIGGGYYGRERSLSGPLNTLVCVQPAACLALAREHHAACSIREGVLTILDDIGQLRIEARSGRLIERIVHSKETEERIRTATEPGGFDRRLRELDARTADFSNAYDPRRPLTSWLRFLRDDPLVGEAYRWLQERDGGEQLPDPKRLDIAWKILDHTVLGTLDRLIVDHASAPESERPGFSIPGGRGFGDHISLETISDQGLTFCLGAADRLFPRGSWPSMLLREKGLAVTGSSNPEYYYSELADLCASTKTGPLCCLVCAATFQSSLPRTAGQFATKGLERLSIDDFHRDRDVLLDREHYLFTAVVAAAGALRTLDNDETEFLLAKLPPDVKAGLQAGATRLRERPDVATADLLDDVLDVAWESGWQAATERALRRLSVGLAQD